MTPYFDSAVLVKLYVPEPNSHDAAAWVGACRGPVALTALHANEVRNAIRLKVCRKEISEAESAVALRRLASDVADGLLRRPLVDWPAVWDKAENLSAQYACLVNCRTLDTLHVATALLLGFRDFVSLDRRQRSLAEHVGLRVKP